MLNKIALTTEQERELEAELTAMLIASEEENAERETWVSPTGLIGWEE